MDNMNKNHILTVFAEQYNQAIKDNPTVLDPQADPWDGPKPIAPNGYAIQFCKVKVKYIGTQKKGADYVDYYEGFDGRICTWEGLTQIEQQIFSKPKSEYYEDVKMHSKANDDLYER